MQKKVFLSFGLALGVGSYLAYQQLSQTDLSNSGSTSLSTGEPLRPATSEGSQAATQESESVTAPQPAGTGSEPRTNQIQQQVENGEAPGTSEFTRAGFFEPFDWGTNLGSAATLQPQQLSFSSSCESHPRFNPSLRPDQWAGQFTQTDSTQRWPGEGIHVIDWNQFWKLGESGVQVSIRWNFESPPLYRVVGYSFSMANPDGYGADALPEKNRLSWGEAKKYVQAFESELLAQGGIAGTRTMTLSSNVFNPAEVSPEDIERAEYTNTRVRGAQTGRMSCNTLYNDLSSLSCRCF